MLAMDNGLLELAGCGEDLPEMVGWLLLADQERLGSFLEDEHDVMEELAGKPSPEEVAAIFLEHLLERRIRLRAAHLTQFKQIQLKLH
jgi:hypothetical protein